MKLRICAAVTLVALAGAAKAEAAAIGIYSDNSTAGTAAGSIVNGQGHTATILTNLTAADLLGLEVLWILNSDNGGYDAAITSNVAAINAFVLAGGVLSFHDRHVSTAATVVPGAAAVTFVRFGGNDVQIDLEPTAPSLVTNGPGGVIDNSTLDNGTSSNHGYAEQGTLPGGAVPVFNDSNPDNIVDFYFGHGLGAVYYSTIPLDFYLQGSGPSGVQANMVNIYAPNELALQASLVAAAVPEPATGMLLVTALASLAARARRRRA